MLPSSVNFPSLTLVYVHLSCWPAPGHCLWRPSYEASWAELGKRALDAPRPGCPCASLILSWETLELLYQLPLQEDVHPGVPVLGFSGQYSLEEVTCVGMQRMRDAAELWFSVVPLDVCKWPVKFLENAKFNFLKCFLPEVLRQHVLPDSLAELCQMSPQRVFPRAFTLYPREHRPSLVTIVGCHVERD